MSPAWMGLQTLVGHCEVNELSRVLEIHHSPHFAGVLLMHFSVPHGDREGDCSTTDAGKDG